MQSHLLNNDYDQRRSGRLLMVVTVLGLDDYVYEISDGKAGTNDGSNDNDDGCNEDMASNF